MLNETFSVIFKHLEYSYMTIDFHVQLLNYVSQWNTLELDYTTEIIKGWIEGDHILNDGWQ